MKEKKKVGKTSGLWKWILCILIAVSMLFSVGCGKSTQSAADSSAAKNSGSSLGGFRMGSQGKAGVETASENSTAKENVSSGGAADSSSGELTGTNGAVDESAQQDTIEADTGTTGTEYEHVEGVNTEQKLIKTVTMSAETTEFDKIVADVRTKTESAGGYVESSDISGNYGGDTTRYAYFVLRVPAEKLDEFTGEIKDASNVQSFSETTEDVTLQYTDMDTHVKALREELDALFTMMEQATSMKDILAIQSQITEVRYEIESYESQLRVYDNQVTYSTIYLDLYEVSRESSTAGTTFGERVKAKFNDNMYQMGQGFQNFMVGLLGGLPILIPIVVICVVVIVVLRKFWKRRKNAIQKKQDD